MSIKIIGELHKSLQGLFKIAPTYANTVVSFLTYSGETLTIQVDSSLIIGYLQNRVPQNTPREVMFWKYENDAFVDVNLSLPLSVWTDVMDEIQRLKSDGYIDVEIIVEELE